MKRTRFTNFKKSKAVQIAMRLDAIKAELASMGLYRTFHKITDVTKQLGWEMEEAINALTAIEKTKKEQKKVR